MATTYSGIYKVKDRNKYNGNPDNVIYRSMWEKYCFLWCDESEEIVKWSSEEVQIPYYYDIDKKYHRYFVDLKITFKNGKTILVEIKPKKQTTPPQGNNRSKRYISEAMTYVKNKNKWEAAEEYAKDRGWEFEIWTEIELEKYRILPKSSLKTPGKLKPLEPIKPFRKKSKKPYK